ncbi:hypothetical protein HY495_00170, partial [Candidatus Woesearchaeota archaeon]|nr:hypothetical protein [Candidatus Woesearchaeota archaeon]
KDKKKATLQIDFLALRDGVILVGEIKYWGIKPLFERRDIHKYRERDLKGIVDGLKYSNNKPEKIPSLLDKIEYVKDKIEEICLDCHFDISEIKEINGVVITISVPPITEYRGVRFISHSQINSLAR